MSINGTLSLPLSSDESQTVKDLGLSGNGFVKDTKFSEGDPEYYALGGKAVAKRTDPLFFDLLSTDVTWNKNATLDKDGYTFTGNDKDGYVLTLGNLVMDCDIEAEQSAILLPDGGPVKVVLTADTTARINNTTGSAMSFPASNYPCIISGTGKLELQSSSASGTLTLVRPLTIEGGNIFIKNKMAEGTGIAPLIYALSYHPSLNIKGGKLSITADRAAIQVSGITIGSGMAITYPEGAEIKNIYDGSSVYVGNGICVFVDDEWSPAGTVIIQPAPSSYSPSYDDDDDVPSPVTVYNDPSVPDATVWLTGSGLSSSDLLVTERNPKGSAYEALLKLANSDDVFATYSIYLRSGKKSTGSAMNLSFDLNAKYAGNDFTLVHQKADTAYEYFYDTADANGDLSFGPLYELSPFMLVKGNLSPAGEENPNTGSDAESVQLLSAVIMAGLVMAVCYVLRQKKKQNG